MRAVRNRPYGSPAGGAERVLVIAYACHPDQGSEPGVGWTWLREIATLHPVTVLTTVPHDARLEEVVNETGLDIEIVPIATRLDSISMDSPLRLLRYFAWLQQAGQRVAQLEATAQFFMGHHLTFACDWLPSPLARLRETPYIWGPVGGATYPPAELCKELDTRSHFLEWVRWGVGTASRATVARSSAVRASIIVSMNQDTAIALGKYGAAVVETNAAFDYSSFPGGAHELESAPRRAVFAGRLLGWKGLGIAIKALSDPRLSQWSLDIFGTGPAQPMLERMVRERRLEDQITFRGRVDREGLLRSLQSSSVFLFPSLHDSAGWAVAEATALGLRIVCFPIGGPRDLAGPNAIILDPMKPVTSVVEALLGFDGRRGVPYRRLDSARIKYLCAAWYETALNDYGFDGGVKPAGRRGWAWRLGKAISGESKPRPTALAQLGSRLHRGRSINGAKGARRGLLRPGWNAKRIIGRVLSTRWAPRCARS